MISVHTLSVSEDGAFQLAGCADGVQVGACTFRPEPHPLTGGAAYRLLDMAVRPESRGLGVGTLMLLSGEDRVRRRFVSEVWLHAPEEAMAFYQKYGWSVAGEADVSAEQRALMVKSLKPPVCGGGRQV